MSEERICETCKHTELNGCDYPCHCCAVVYQNTGFSDMWEKGGCEFCNELTDEDIINVRYTFKKKSKPDYRKSFSTVLINCPLCGKKI